ncbi:MAG: hypothetical protein HY675_17465 [Chloroflexi bacterium]|nr:hypothetical protein [Chloroflexota bacterium]
MQLTKTARPLAGWQARQGSGRGSMAGATDQPHSSAFTPVAALAVHKPGRGTDGWPVVAAITQFLDDPTPILRVTWRGQHGTDRAISLPVCVLDYAARRGVTAFYLRDDRQMKMWTCPLSTFSRGKLQADGERYVPLAWLTLVPWRDWLYADDVVRLGDTPTEPATAQLALGW